MIVIGSIISKLEEKGMGVDLLSRRKIYFISDSYRI
ncbi:MAG: hypothetical protein ACJASU_002526 [Cognaticolwellia sp.]|jgi:hypothetical protein